MKKSGETSVTGKNSYLQRLSLENQNIIITGACGLLGREFCKSVAETGGNLILGDIDQQSGKELAGQLKNEYGVRAAEFPLDISRKESVADMLNWVGDEFGIIHGLVNSAYPRNSQWGTPFASIQLESWRENIDLHLNGYFNVCQQTARIMIEQGQGKIINLASIYGFVAPDFRIYEGTAMTLPAEYSVIKGGIINFTRYLATCLASYGIRANCISPGGIFDHQPESFVENYCARTPMGRMGNPEDIAGAVLYLLSDLAGYVTGQNLVVDGGWSAW